MPHVYLFTVSLLFTSSVTSKIVHLMQIWFDFQQEVINVAVDKWRDRTQLRMLVRLSVVVCTLQKYALKWIFSFVAHENVLWNCPCYFKYLIS